MAKILSTLALALLAMPTASAFSSTSPNTATTSQRPATASRTFRSPRLFATTNTVALPFSKRDVNARLPGTFWGGAKSTYVLDFDWMVSSQLGFRKRVMAAFRFFFMGGLLEFVKSFYALYFRSTPVTIHDARMKEAEEGLSKSDFFDKYGFVILDAPSAMTAEGWKESDRDLGKQFFAAYNNRTVDGGASYGKVMDDFRNGDTAVKKVYAPEAADLIRSIVPRAKVILPPARGIRRYLTKNPNKAPAKQVHNDYGLDFEDVVSRNPFFDFDEQRALYEETEADEYMLVNLWRPVKPMAEPCRSFPLCFLDSSTLSEDDFVTIDSKSLGVATGLKENSAHRFYYYPDQTVDEVVVFKQFHQFRNESIARMPTFHTAFADPAADKSTEGRVSFEYRVGLLC